MIALSQFRVVSEAYAFAIESYVSRWFHVSLNSSEPQSKSYWSVSGAESKLAL